MKKNNLKLNIYPNPTSDKFEIQTNFKIKNIDVFDISGRLIKVFKINSNSYDVSMLKGGVYLIKIETEDIVVIRKFIKQ